MSVNALSAMPETEVSAATVRLSCRELRHRYGRRVGLERVSFELASPGLVAVTGPNGSGKSTLLRILAGLLRPSEGGSTLVVAGREVAPAERRHVVGFASPTLAFYDELSVAENLRFAAEALGMRDPRAAVAGALERVELAERAGDRVAALSSGLLQRLRIAFAILRQPPVLLLDEPGSHLDEAGHAVVARLVRDEGSRAMVVLATNDPREWTLAERRIELGGRGLGHSS